MRVEFVTLHDLGWNRYFSIRTSFARLLKDPEKQPHLFWTSGQWFSLPWCYGKVWCWQQDQSRPSLSFSLVPWNRGSIEEISCFCRSQTHRSNPGMWLYLVLKDETSQSFTGLTMCMKMKRLSTCHWLPREITTMSMIEDCINLGNFFWTRRTWSEERMPSSHMLAWSPFG